MIIKEKSIKSHKGVENALRYLLSKGLEGTGIILRRFLRGDRPFEALLELAEGNLEESSIIMEKRIANLLQQLKQNDQLRQIKRKNGVKYYHSIISFHREDQLTKEALLRTAQRFVKERYPKSQALFIPHYDKAHIHLHALAGAVEFGTGKVHRLTRKEFTQVKQRMEAWQDRELELVHSRVNHTKKKERMLLRDVERELNLKGKQSEKQRLHLELGTLYHKAKSAQDFYDKLQNSSLSVYHRGGRIVGVQGNKRRYRLKTLGYSTERVLALEIKTQTQQRLRQLHQKQHEKEQKQDKHIDHNR